MSDGAEASAALEGVAKADVAAKLRSKPSSKLICAHVGLRSKSDCDSTASEDDATAAVAAGGADDCVPCMMCTMIVCEVRHLCGPSEREMDGRGGTRCSRPNQAYKRE